MCHKRIPDKLLTHTDDPRLSFNNPSTPKWDAWRSLQATLSTCTEVAEVFCLLACRLLVRVP